jgi:hypothetical protein
MTPSLPSFPAPGAWVGRLIEPVEADAGLDAFRPAHHLADEVVIDGEIASAVLHVTAHGIYETAPGPGCTPHLVSVDITSCSHPRAMIGP